MSEVMKAEDPNEIDVSSIHSVKMTDVKKEVLNKAEISDIHSVKMTDVKKEVLNNAEISGIHSVKTADVKEEDPNEMKISDYYDDTLIKAAYQHINWEEFEPIEIQPLKTESESTVKEEADKGVWESDLNSGNNLILNETLISVFNNEK